jgi:hypothetical protein
VPAGQATQSDALESKIDNKVSELLDLQVAEEFAPVALEYVPFGQSMHAPSPTKSLYLPAGQSVQAKKMETCVYTE